MKLKWFVLYFFTLVGLCGEAFGGISRLKSTTNDHLEPPDERFEPAYRKLLSRKLFTTPANYVRIVDLPSPASVGETSIAIYSKPDKPDEILITSTKAARNLYYAAFSDDPNSPKDPPMEITRCDASFPKFAADAITEGIRRTLANTHPRKKGDSIILHGTEIEFSIDDRLGRNVRGLLTPYAKGKTGAALRRLTELLEKYCKTKSENRAVLVKEIESQARHLKGG